MHHRLALVTTLAALAFAGLSPALRAQQYTHTFTDGEDSAEVLNLDTYGSNRADLYVNGTDSATQSGAINGTGTWYKFGTGTLTLTGTLASTARPFVWAGKLVAGADQTLNSLYVYQDGTLDLGAYTYSTNNNIQIFGNVTGTTGALNISGTNNLFQRGTISANVTGSGQMIVRTSSGNQVALTGHFGQTGGTWIDANTSLNLGAGTNSGSIAGAIAITGTLSLNRTDDFTLDNALSGTGTLEKVGANTVTLTGANTMSGSLSVGGTGRLVLGTDLASIGGVYVQASTLDLQNHSVQANTLWIYSGGEVTATTGVITLSNRAHFSYTGNATVNAVLAGAGKLELNSGLVGRVTLTRANTYTGVTTVNAGTLLVNGSTSASSVVTVKSGGTIGGSGTIGGATTIQSGGTLAPGNSPGLLTFGGDLTLNSGSNSSFEIDGTGRGSTYDAVNVAGLTTFGGTLALDFGATIADGSVLNLFGGSGTKTGDFDYITATGSYSGSFTDNNGYWTLVSGGQTLAFSIVTGNLAFGVSAVPEPSTYAALAGVAALGLAFGRRRRVRSAT